MPDYYVKWSINIEADSHHEAAKKALEIQRDPTSLATEFKVTLSNEYKTIDLLEDI